MTGAAVVAASPFADLQYIHTWQQRSCIVKQAIGSAAISLAFIDC